MEGLDITALLIEPNTQKEDKEKKYFSFVNTKLEKRMAINEMKIYLWTKQHIFIM